MQQSTKLWIALATSGFLAMAPTLVSAQGAGTGSGTGSTTGGVSKDSGQGRSSTGSNMGTGQGNRTTTPTERDMTTNSGDNERDQTGDLGTTSESDRRTSDGTSGMGRGLGSSESPSGQSPAGQPPPSPSGQSPAGQPPPSPSGQAMSPSGSSSANQ
jgi:hypothetical protein